MEKINSLKTPCFILDKEELSRSIKGFQVALNNRFADWTIGYSVKTNSLPYCLSIANKQGCYAEVVSDDEYELALLCGFRKDHIVYNGPMKSRESLIDALDNGSIVNIETHRELEWLKDLPKDKLYSVGLRLNVNISKISPEDAIGDNDDSRFGFSYETEEFNNAIESIYELNNVKLSGIHIHRTSHSRSVRFYKNSLRYACEAIKKYHLQLDYIDIGGGYFGIFRDKPTYQQYVDSFKEVLASYELDNLKIIVEPGNALVASCFSFLSEVIDVKHIEGNRWYITTDGSRNDVDPLFRKTSYFFELLSDRDGSIVDEQIVTGCTCLEFDRLFTLTNNPLLKVGDRIVYKNVGAYTMCLTPLFIRYLPNVYAWDGNDYQLVREKWTANEYIEKSVIE